MDWRIVSPDHVYVNVNEHVRFDAFRIDRPKWCAMLWAVAYSYDGVVMDTVTTGEPVDGVRNWWKFLQEENEVTA